MFAFEKPGHRVEPTANDDESMEIEWVPVDDVPNRKLLTAMRTDWPNFAARLRALAAVRYTARRVPPPWSMRGVCAN